MRKEDRKVLFIRDIIEIQSGLNILLSAIRNEYDKPELSDIENLLEIITAKYSKLTNEAKELLAD